MLRANQEEIEFAIAERQSTEDRFHIRARTFIDCTGDGRLAFEAGAAFMRGRESTAEFGDRQLKLHVFTPDLSPSVSDRTHFSRKGALAMARLVLATLPNAESRLKYLLRYGMSDH